jgi:peroxidase
LPVNGPRNLANGLSYDFHADSCPNLVDIVWPIVESAVLGEIAIAAGLLRIFFHDCFPQGCDASVLLTGANSELDLPPNLSLQTRALQLIEDVRVKVHAACGATVSCADILTLATRDAVFVVRAHLSSPPVSALVAAVQQQSQGTIDLLLHCLASSVAK